MEIQQTSENTSPLSISLDKNATPKLPPPHWYPSQQQRYSNSTEKPPVFFIEDLPDPEDSASSKQEHKPSNTSSLEKTRRTYLEIREDLLERTEAAQPGWKKTGAPPPWMNIKKLEELLVK